MPDSCQSLNQLQLISFLFDLFTDCYDKVLQAHTSLLTMNTFSFKVYIDNSV